MAGVSTLAVFAALVCVCLLPQCYGRSRSSNKKYKVKPSRLSKQVEKLKDRADILTNELKLLQEKTHFDGTPFTDAPPDLFEPVSINRDTPGDQLKVTVTYKRPKDLEVTARWRYQWDEDFLGAEENDEVVQDTRNPWVVYASTSYVTKLSTDRNDLFLELQSDFKMFSIHVTSKGNGSLMTDIKIPHDFMLEPNQDLEYRIGRNVTFKVISSKPSSRRLRSRTSIRMAQLKQGEDKIEWTSDREQVNLIMSTKKKEYFEYNEETFLVNTAHHNTSGIIFVSHETSDGKPRGFADGSDNDLLYYIDITKMTLSLHPSTQSGPFPDGFVEFHPGLFAAVNSEGTETQICKTDRPSCDVTCEVYGTSLASGILSKVGAPGNFTEVDTAKNAVDHWKLMTYSLATSGLTIGQFEEFQCQVTSYQGVTSERRIRLLPVLPVKFVNNQTTVEKVGRNWVFICTVSGKPRPKITFHYSTYSENVKQSMPYQVDGDKSVARLIVTEPEPPTTTSTTRTNRTTGSYISSASCVTEQDYGDIGEWRFPSLRPVDVHMYNVGGDTYA